MSELYKEAATLLQKLEKRQGGLKSLAYDDSVQNKRSSFALVCETLRYKPLLTQLLNAVPQFQFHKKLVKKNGESKSKNSSTNMTLAMLYISLYDLLFSSRQKIQGGGHLKKEIMNYQIAFREALVRLKIKAKVSTNEALLPEANRRQNLSLPRYIRLNTLKINAEEIQVFLKEFSEDIQQDRHIRNVYVLPPGTKLHDHPYVKEGKIILQDKASCFPAYILHGNADYDSGDVIDACAAPGNKTSHIAMLLHEKQLKSTKRKRKVFAFDRDPTRLALLKKRMEIAGAGSMVDCCLQSFLDIDVNDAKYSHVTSILLDPSCSGSGMTNRLDHLLDIASGLSVDGVQEYGEVVDVEKRLDSLADFQLQVLLKAFSFPNVTRITYSTCSIFEKENEGVVCAALQSDINQQRKFQLKKCLPSWPRRGIACKDLTSQESDCLVRADGREDSTNGFFVAYFERVNVNEHVVSIDSINKQKRPHNDSNKKSMQKRSKRRKKKENKGKNN